MPSFAQYLANAKAAIREIEPNELSQWRTADAIVLDVREREEYQDGAIVGAQWLSRGVLETSIEKAFPNREQRIIVYCAGGTRSALATVTLQALGYRDVVSLRGGFSAYKQAGGEWAKPKGLDRDHARRFARHLRLAEVGEAGQARLLAARVLLIGAGGLGSPSALYLAAAGVGCLGLVDDDRVDESNLQRQVLHTTARVGMLKVDSAEVSLRELWPDIRIEKHPTRLGLDNAVGLIQQYDLVIDGSDNFATRYIVNDAAIIAGKPVVHASVFRFEGHLTVFSSTGKPCYRCVFPSPPPASAAPSCSEAGVLGVLPGTLGVMQATEAIKILLGIGEPLLGRLWVYDALGAKVHTLRTAPDPRCPACSVPSTPPILGLIDDPSCKNS